MTTDCKKWHDALLDAALTGIPENELGRHLSGCSRCTQQLTELRSKRERMDALLPLVVQGNEPSPGFRARVVAAASEKDQKHRRRFWPLAAAAAVLVAALGIGIGQLERSRTYISANEHVAAQKLAEWRAPTDVLLEAPAPETQEALPKLGESYFQVPTNKDWEE